VSFGVEGSWCVLLLIFKSTPTFGAGSIRLRARSIPPRGFKSYINSTPAIYASNQPVVPAPSD
jgi:hypothetical protein